MAANNRGIQLVGDLIEEYGLDVVQAYMHYIQARPTPDSTRRASDDAPAAHRGYLISHTWVLDVHELVSINDASVEPPPSPLEFEP